MATLHELWEDLFAAGLVGTDRRPYAPEPAGAGPGRLLAGLQLRYDDPARTWLAAAGALAVLRLAGREPASLPLAGMEPSPPEAWPRCCPAAARHLAQMLNGEFEDCLPEWLAAAAAHRQRVPEELLPQLLDWARARPELRAHVVAVIGARGRWLAAQNERWAYAARFASVTASASLDELLETWELAVLADRLALLQQQRLTDPAQALRLVQHTWAQDTVDERLAYLKHLAVGLSLADEPFLESVLRERAWSPRQAAARLLSQLPESQLCQRVRALARPLLRLEGGPRGPRKRGASAGPSLRLRVNLPEAGLAALQREGASLSKPPTDADRARWLAQMLAAVPPGEWCQAFHLSPAQLVVLARANVYDFALVEGWAAAAVAFGDADWAEALLRERLPELDNTVLPALLRALPPVRREAVVYAALSSVERLPVRQPALRLLQAYTEPWSARQTSLLMDKLQDELTRRDVPFGAPVDFHWLRGAALHWEAAVAAAAIPALRQAQQAARQPDGGWLNWHHTIEPALALCAFRQALLKELQP
jgi:hypothetical protein